MKPVPGFPHLIQVPHTPTLVQPTVCPECDRELNKDGWCDCDLRCSCCDELGCEDCWTCNHEG